MPDMMDVKDIAFPNLGIYLHNIPKKFTVFGFDIAFYGVIIGIGVLLGVLMAVHIAKKEKMDPDIIWDFAIYAVIFSVIGARLYYVALTRAKKSLYIIFKRNAPSCFINDPYIRNNLTQLKKQKSRLTDLL